ncbi:MAG TPA: hypothetical protein VGX70_21025 [Gemmataceae bacterium]|jgi:hypothetical protein|nr:hypothetical protein [Gemmataceae bacterium]
MTTTILLLVLSPVQLPPAAIDALNHLSESRLQVLLKDWENANQNIGAAHYLIDWTREDRVLKDKEVFQIEGSIKRSKLARIDLKDNRGKTTIIYLLNDKVFDIYNFANELKYSFEIPAGFPETYVPKEGLEQFLARSFQQERQLFYFEFPFGEIGQLFDIRLRKEDKDWSYIRLIPKSEEKKSLFREMEVVLDQKTHLVRQYRMLDVNGNRNIYDFAKIEINPTPEITLESISKTSQQASKSSE